jgi:hypothetical protein
VSEQTGFQKKKNKISEKNKRFFGEKTASYKTIIFLKIGF